MIRIGKIDLTGLQKPVRSLYLSGDGAHVEGFHQLGVVFEGDAGDDAEVGQPVV
jgi:hypothetical protein